MSQAKKTSKKGKKNTPLPEVNKSNQVDDLINEKIKFFYDTYADTKFLFDDGKEIKFNKMLFYWSAMTPPFYSMFYGPLKTDVIEIKDANYTTFKLFVDCVMGLQEITKESAGVIFPIACKYLVQKCMEDCARALEPAEMNIEVCNLLNMAFIHNFMPLVEVIKNAALNKHSAHALLEKKDFCNMLSCEAFVEVVKWVKMDSCIFETILKWTNNHLKQNKETMTVKDFLKKLGIMDKMKTSSFESSSLLHAFSSSTLGKDFFTPNEIKAYDKKEKFPERKCKWVSYSKGKTLEEEIDISDIWGDREITIKVGDIVMYHSADVNDSVTCEVSLASGHRLEKPKYIKEKNAFVVKFDDDYTDYQYPGPNDYEDDMICYIKWTFKKNCRVLLTNKHPLEEKTFSEDEWHLCTKIIVN